MRVSSRAVRNVASGAALAAALLVGTARDLEAVNCFDFCAGCAILLIDCQACTGSGCDMIGWACEGGFCVDCGSGWECHS